MQEKSFVVPGIHCGHCTATIERELGGLDGVSFVKADPASKEVVVRWSDPADWAAIEALLVEIEFPPAA